MNIVLTDAFNILSISNEVFFAACVTAGPITAKVHFLTTEEEKEEEEEEISILFD